MSIRAKVLEKKIADMKGMLRCISGGILPDGTLRSCSGCSDDIICRQIQWIIEDKIRRACYSVKEKGQPK